MATPFFRDFLERNNPEIIDRNYGSAKAITNSLTLVPRFLSEVVADSVLKTKKAFNDSGFMDRMFKPQNQRAEALKQRAEIKNKILRKQLLDKRNKKLKFIQDKAVNSIQDKPVLNTLTIPENNTNVTQSGTAQDLLKQETNPFLQALQEQAQKQFDEAKRQDLFKTQAFNQNAHNQALSATEASRLNAKTLASLSGNAAQANDYVRYQANPITLNQQSTGSQFAQFSPNRRATINGVNVLNQDGSVNSLADKTARVTRKQQRQKNQKLLFNKPSTVPRFKGVMSDAEIKQARGF